MSDLAGRGLPPRRPVAVRNGLALTALLAVVYALSTVLPSVPIGRCGGTHAVRGCGVRCRCAAGGQGGGGGARAGGVEPAGRRGALIPAGDTVFSMFVEGRPAPFPSAADACYVAFLALTFAGLVVLLRPSCPREGGGLAGRPDRRGRVGLGGHRAAVRGRHAGWRPRRLGGSDGARLPGRDPGAGRDHGGHPVRAWPQAQPQLVDVDLVVRADDRQRSARAFDRVRCVPSGLACRRALAVRPAVAGLDRFECRAAAACRVEPFPITAATPGVFSLAAVTVLVIDRVSARPALAVGLALLTLVLTTRGWRWLCATR